MQVLDGGRGYIESMGEMLDTVIVGAGVAGLSAAIFLGRAGRSTVVYDGGKPRIFAVETVRELPGFDGASPAAMLREMREEATRYGVTFQKARVERIVPLDDGTFEVHAPGGTRVARTVVLATGLVDEVPPLEGVPEAWGRDLRVCPCFDGYEVRGGRFVVFGVPARLTHMAAWVSMWSPDVTVVTRTAFGEADAEKLRLLGIPVVHDEVKGLRHEGERLVALLTASGARIPCDAAWVTLDARAASELPASLCDVDEAGIAKIDAGGHTSRPGVFAVGNASFAGRTSPRRSRRGRPSARS